MFRIKVKIWNKIDRINGVEAIEVLKSMPELQRLKEVILIEDDYGNITNIENPNIIKANLNLPIDITTSEVGEAYIEYLESQKNEVKKISYDESNIAEKLDMVIGLLEEIKNKK